MFPSYPQALAISEGAKLESADDSRVVFIASFPLSDIGRAGRVPSASLLALAESVASYAMERNLPEGCRLEPLSVDANFLRAAHDHEVRVEAVPLQTGNTIAKWEVTMRNPQGRALMVVTDTRLIEPDSSDVLTTGDLDRLARARLDTGSAPHRDAASEVALNSAAAPACDLSEAAAPNAPGASTSDLRRGQILRAAFEVIADKGFANASMRQIAQRAGLSVPAVYQYVRSKDELLEEIFAGYIKRMEHAVQNSAIQNQSATEQLRAAISASMTEFDRYQAEIRVMNRESKALRHEVRQRIKWFVRSYIELFRRIIANGVESGEFRLVEANLYANFIPMLCDVWPLRNWAVRPYGDEQVRDAIVDLLVHALAPAPKPSRRAA